MVADLVSLAPLPLPTIQALDAAQTAKLDKQAGQIQKMHTRMAPMTADIGKIMAQCGEDEACITREVQKMGAAMAGTPKADAMLKSGKDTARAVQLGAPRYQTWIATAQRGKYAIDESLLSVLADPACQPTLRCTRNEGRAGSGALRPRSATAKDVGLFYAVEVDTAKHTLTIVPQGPPLPLPYPRQLVFREIAYGNDKPFTVAIKGGWRSQSGQQEIRVKDGGKLTIRWRFQTQ